MMGGHLTLTRLSGPEAISGLELDSTAGVGAVGKPLALVSSEGWVPICSNFLVESHNIHYVK